MRARRRRDDAPMQPCNAKIERELRFLYADLRVRSQGYVYDLADNHFMRSL